MDGQQRNGRSNGSLIAVKELKTYFYTDEGVARAVDNVTLEIYPGETLGLVGESGSGKSVTALSIMGLIPSPPGKIESGEIIFQGRDLLDLPEKVMKTIRGNRISMIFQEPMTSLNPVFRVGHQIAEAIALHQDVSKQEAWEKSVEMLNLVGIPSPRDRAKNYPHQLSGGMRQRVMIAMALSCHPALMIADEPTTALDVTIQAQILDLMNRLKEDVGTSILLITHDLGVVAEMAQRVSVMYAGVVVESAAVKTLFGQPLHPYTRGLLNSIPRVDKHAGRQRRLHAIPGIVPSLLDLPVGCRFLDRCDKAIGKCRQEGEPELVEVAENHFVRCWLHSGRR
ncbi:MAG: ABC transporter ATP-binding protein [Deltaproteobacteria bacterium]|nr:ABC transporter ATP-binding protein [Deltaproteobacteria bacterium]